jgi:hypothetical protein
VITADNPRGERLDPRDNAAPQQRLASSLRRCDGCCPDAIHRERGFAAVLPLEQAMALAAEFGQSAIYWFDGESIWLVPVLEAAMPERLGGTSPRSPPESIG